MTAYNAEEDKKWSCEKKMGEDDGLRTLECLRGRLLAERQASRTYKENAELLGNKLVELEKKLKEETKMRKKAGKRLKVLVKKLECLNISSNFEASEQSSPSGEISSSSSVSTSGFKSQGKHSADSQDDIVTQNSFSNDINQNFSSLIPDEESSRNQDVSDSSSDKANSSTQSSPESKAEDQRYPIEPTLWFS